MKNKSKTQESTFDKMMKNDKERELFDEEYNDFLISEFLLEAMKDKKITVRDLSKKSSVSTSIIQNLRTKNTSNITIKTLNSLFNTLGYRIKIEKV
jgi:DNA-binding Xre family transcriptional regulator